MVLVILSFVVAGTLRARSTEVLPPPGYVTFIDPIQGGIRGIVFGKQSLSVSAADELSAASFKDDAGYTVLYNWTAPPISGNGQIAQGTLVYQGPTVIDGQGQVWAVGVATGKISGIGYRKIASLRT